MTPVFLFDVINIVVLIDFFAVAAERIEIVSVFLFLVSMEIKSI